MLHVVLDDYSYKCLFTNNFAKNTYKCYNDDIVVLMLRELCCSVGFAMLLHYLLCL